MIHSKFLSSTKRNAPSGSNSKSISLLWYSREKERGKANIFDSSSSSVVAIIILSLEEEERTNERREKRRLSSGDIEKTHNRKKSLLFSFRITSTSSNWSHRNQWENLHKSKKIDSKNRTREKFRFFEFLKTISLVDDWSLEEPMSIREICVVVRSFVLWTYYW